MSMSQEDIESLMNGLDMPAQDSVETIKEEPIPEDKVNSATENVKETVKKTAEKGTTSKGAKFCTNCGAELTGGKFCSKCGHEIH